MSSDPSLGPLLDRIESLYSESLVLEPNDDRMRAMTDWVVDFAKQFHSDVEGERVPAWVAFDPKTVTSELIAEGLPEDPIDGDDDDTAAHEEPPGWQKLFERVNDQMMRPGINFASPMNFGYIPSGGVYPSALADLWAAVTNRFAGMFFACPGAVKVENMLIRWMAKEMGLEHPDRAGGCLTSGGSLATVSALVCARETHKVLTGGADGKTLSNQFVVYMTDQTHSCGHKALNLIGCGHLHIRHVPRDKRLRMIPAELDAMMAADVAAGLHPWVVIITAGTTNCGAIDPIVENGTIAKKYRAWVHIDGAIGGMMVLSADGRRALGGDTAFRVADSIAADPHKMLWLPYGTGMLVVPNGDLLRQTHSFTAPYLQRFLDDANEVSSADVSAELSKHFRALRMYLPLRIFGVAAFRAAQSEKMLLARYFHIKMSTDQRFVVFEAPQLSIVMYRARGIVDRETNVEDMTVANRRSDHIMEHMITHEKFMFISATSVDGVTWLRLAVGVFRTHRRHIEEAIYVLGKAIDAVLAQEQQQ